MKTGKKLGIWMDHSTANLMEFSINPIETKTIESKFTHQAKEHSLSRGEGIMHHREQHQQAEYYKKLGEIIKNYDDVLLFGPTEAKDELFNILRADNHFEKVKIKTKHADKMTENQQHAFVKEYFSAN
jgi:nitrogenase subunit NifH